MLVVPGDQAVVPRLRDTMMRETLDRKRLGVQKDVTQIASVTRSDRE